MKTLVDDATRPLSRRTEVLEQLVGRLLGLLGRMTGLESTYLTAIDWSIGVQEIVHARNVGALDIPEGLRVVWEDTLCRRALEGGPTCTSDVPGIYPESGAARDLGIRTYVTVPVRDPQGEIVGTLCGASTETVNIRDDGLLLMETLAEMIRLHLAVEANVNELEQLSLTDALTGLANRRHIDREMHRIYSRATRHGGTVSMIILDVDNFKLVNDTDGHDSGDAVLVAVAAALRQVCREEDTIGRWGGDEFVVVCSETAEDGAGRLAERVRDTLAALVPPVSVSVGTATATDSRFERLLAAADGALYDAKRHGRAQVRSVVVT